MQLAGAVDHPQAATQADVLALQQRYGNRAVQRLIQRAPVPKSNEEERSGEIVTVEAPTAPEPATRSRSNAITDAPVIDQANEPQSAPTTEGPSPQAPEPTTRGRSNAVTERPTTGTAPGPQDGHTPPGPHNAPTTPAPNLVPGSRNILRMQSLAHDEKVLPVLKRFMAGENASRNYNFYFDTSDNKSLYAKYVADGSAQQVALPGSIKEPLDEMARAKRWSAMAAVMDKARAENQSIINGSLLPRFVQTEAYKKLEGPAKPKSVLDRIASAFSRGATEAGPESERPGFIGPVMPRQMQITRRMVPPLERGIERYTRFYENGKKTIDRVGLPSDRRAVDRMYEDGRVRHARVVAIFTRRYAADSNFRAASYGPFFAKLKAFTKLWTEYQKLLGR